MGPAGPVLSAQGSNCIISPGTQAQVPSGGQDAQDYALDPRNMGLCSERWEHATLHATLGAACDVTLTHVACQGLDPHCPLYPPLGCRWGPRGLLSPVLGLVPLGITLRLAFARLVLRPLTPHWTDTQA